jgi:hypothetical protein
MKTFTQCLVVPAGQTSVEFLTREHLLAFFPEVKTPDLSRAVVEDIWVKQVASSRDDVYALHLLHESRQTFSRVFDWQGRPSLAVVMPMAVSEGEGEARPPPSDINLADLKETDLYKSVQPGNHDLRTIDIDMTLSARLPKKPAEVDEAKYEELVREHLLNDTIVDLTKPLKIELVTAAASKQEAADTGVLIITIAARMALVSEPLPRR